MAVFPADVAKLGGSTRLCNCLRNLDEKSMEEVIARLEHPHLGGGGEAYFLRQPNFGRRTLEELKAIVPLWKANNNRNVGTVALFTEALDRMLEAQQDLAVHPLKSPKWNDALERRNRLRTTLIETIERLL